MTPVRVVCLYNAMTQLSHKGLHTLTFHLCHSFFNWLGTVKMPAPTEYASRMVKFIGDHRTAEPVFPRNLDNGFYYL